MLMTRGERVTYSISLLNLEKQNKKKYWFWILKITSHLTYNSVDKNFLNLEKNLKSDFPTLPDQTLDLLSDVLGYYCLLSRLVNGSKFYLNLLILVRYDNESLIHLCEFDLNTLISILINKSDIIIY